MQSARGARAFANGDSSARENDHFCAWAQRHGQDPCTRSGSRPGRLPKKGLSVGFTTAAALVSCRCLMEARDERASPCYGLQKTDGPGLPDSHH